MTLCPACGIVIEHFDPISMTIPQLRRLQCTFYGRTVQLSYNEAELLAVLLIRRGRPTSFNNLVGLIYPDPDDEPDWSVNCVRVTLHRMRKKLPGLVATRKNFGPMIELHNRGNRW